MATLVSENLLIESSQPNVSFHSNEPEKKLLSPSETVESQRLILLTDLLSALKLNQPEEVQRLLEKPIIKLTSQGTFETLGIFVELFKAAAKNDKNLTVLMALLKGIAPIQQEDSAIKGAAIGILNNIITEDVYLMAAFAQQLEILTYLDSHPELNIPGNIKGAALEDAAMHKHTKVIKFLLEQRKGADIPLEKKVWFLKHAVKTMNLNYLKILFSTGIELPAESIGSEFIAAARNGLEVVKCFYAYPYVRNMITSSAEGSAIKETAARVKEIVHSSMELQKKSASLNKTILVQESKAFSDSLQHQLDTFDFLLQQAEHEVLNICVPELLKFATKDTGVDLLRSLLKHVKLKKGILGKAFEKAAQRGQLQIVKCLAQKVPLKLSADKLGMALIKACKNKERDIANYILSVFGEKISFVHQVIAFWEGFKSDPRTFFSLFTMFFFESKQPIEVFLGEKAPLTDEELIVYQAHQTWEEARKVLAYQEQQKKDERKQEKKTTELEETLQRQRYRM